jgi:hypothetical protein
MREVARRLFSVVQEAHILIVLRNQVDLLRSFYDTYPYATWNESTQYIRLSDWVVKALREKEKSIAGALYFDQAIVNYQNFLGSERVKVLLFEDLFGGVRTRLRRQTWRAFFAWRLQTPRLD